MKKGKKRIVVALGGNALGNTPQEQISQVRFAAEIIADLVAEGHEIVIGHGNGPKVGIINAAMNYAAVNGPCTPYISGIYRLSPSASSSAELFETGP